MPSSGMVPRIQFERTRGSAAILVFFHTCAILHHMKTNRFGFTLTELMIVVIIISILAAISVPMMQVNLKNAAAAEAIAVLGAVRRAQKTYYAEYGQYVPFSATNTKLSMYLDFASLNGTYFDMSAYTMPIGLNPYLLRATGSDSTAPKHSFVTGMVINMDSDGNTSHSGY